MLCVIVIAGTSFAREARQPVPPAAAPVAPIVPGTAVVPFRGSCNESDQCGQHGQCNNESQCICDDGYISEAFTTGDTGCKNGDLAALVSFNYPGSDPRGILATTWRCAHGSYPCSYPCDSIAEMPTWNDPQVGFVGIMCNELGGRVTFFNVYPAIARMQPPTCDLLANIDPLAGLPFLETLSLDGCTNVHGNIEVLGSLHQLRYLNLRDTSVYGAVESLSSLSHLGQFYRAPDGTCSEQCVSRPRS